MKYLKMFESWMMPVVKFDLKGNYVDEYECIGDAAKANGLERSTLGSMMNNGKPKTYHGFIYRNRYQFAWDGLNDLRSGKTNLYTSKKSGSFHIDEKPLTDKYIDIYYGEKDELDEASWYMKIPFKGKYNGISFEVSNDKDLSIKIRNKIPSRLTSDQILTVSKFIEKYKSFLSMESKTQWRKVIKKSKSNEIS